MSADYSDTEKAALDERELIARWLHMHASPTLAKCVRCGVHAGSSARQPHGSAARPARNRQTTGETQ